MSPEELEEFLSNQRAQYAQLSALIDHMQNRLTDCMLSLMSSIEMLRETVKNKDISKSIESGDTLLKS